MLASNPIRNYHQLWTLVSTA